MAVRRAAPHLRPVGGEPRYLPSRQHSRLGVLRGTYRGMPAVLLELGFLTSPYDAMLLKDKHFRDSAAKAIADALHRSL